MRGEGVHADLLAQRFYLATRRLGFAGGARRPYRLRCDLFQPPLVRKRVRSSKATAKAQEVNSRQMRLF